MLFLLCKLPGIQELCVGLSKYKEAESLQDAALAHLQCYLRLAKRAVAAKEMLGLFLTIRCHFIYNKFLGEP